MHFTFTLWWPQAAALGQTSDVVPPQTPNLLPLGALSSLFTQGDADVHGQSRQAVAPRSDLGWGGATVSRGAGWLVGVVGLSPVGGEDTGRI